MVEEGGGEQWGSFQGIFQPAPKMEPVDVRLQKDSELEDYF
jgi:hypothetical protein